MVSERRQRERRGAEERRAFSRRVVRRRRNTPKPYSDWELAAIQQQHAEPGTRARCPVCSGVFTLSPEERRGNHRMRRVQCTSCGQFASVTDSASRRVIVVAQGEVMRQTLRAVLSEDGHEVLEVADAALGLWAFGQNPADAVFLDLHAPGGMGPEEFVRLLHREHPDARVIAISTRPGVGTSDPVALAEAIGAAGLVRLPCTDQELLGTLQRARL